MSTPERRRTVSCLLLALASPFLALPVVAGDVSLSRNAPELGLDPIFGEDFESGECAAWSSTSYGPAGPDADNDTFGDASQPVVYCVLPAGLVPNATDCDDGDFDIHPGALELCDLVDNDCDQGVADDGAGEPWFLEACDGGDTDLCTEGARHCVGGQPACDDVTGSTVDVCNGQDDDCDGASADGSEDPLVGAACDSTADSDLCATGTNSCTGGGLVCSDDAASLLDVCDGADNDCDPASNDGTEDPLFGASCDSPADSDLCATGTNGCTGGGLVCSDDAVSTFDLCNGQDDDCDVLSGDGSEDPQVGASCDSPVDTDFCATGTNSCQGGGLVCSDDAASTVEICDGNGGDEDCDGQVDEGFVRDTNPACSAFELLGTVSGDIGGDLLVNDGFEEVWNLVKVSEDNNNPVRLGASISLFSPAGVDFDLYVYCLACNGTLAGSSTTHNLVGHTDTVLTRADDDFGEDDTHDLLIEVRYVQGGGCATWQLSVTGNAAAAAQTCNP